MDDSSDNIRVIGWGNDEKCTVYAIEVFDDNVEYIEMGNEPNRIRQYVNDKHHIIFNWDVQLQWSDFNGIAYSKNDQSLYELRYPNNTNYINQTHDLRWYPIIKEGELN
ncbi:MAG: hypothetical protein N4A63_13095 [Vallitalea sp.]|jgi:hypothetical protein|nr:hypothetical protein [Vallitalea sp.]